MSRSYKKNPVCKDTGSNGRRFAKRRASQLFRRKIELDEDMPARPQHKKMTESWEICDYRTRMTETEAIEWYYYRSEREDYFKKRYPTLEKWLKAWRKWYKNK